MKFRNLVFAFLLSCVVAPVSGCDAPTPPTDQSAKIDLPGPKPDPNRDEAAELIKACGLATSDTSKIVEGGTQRILGWHRYGVDVFFLQNGTDSPKWSSTAVFVGEDNIDRKTLSRKMPCSKKTSLFSVDVLDRYLLNK